MTFLPGPDSTKKLMASDQLSNLLMLDPMASLMASVKPDRYMEPRSSFTL